MFQPCAAGKECDADAGSGGHSILPVQAIGAGTGLTGWLALARGKEASSLSSPPSARVACPCMGEGENPRTATRRSKRRLPSRAGRRSSNIASNSSSPSACPRARGGVASTLRSSSLDLSARPRARGGVEYDFYGSIRARRSPSRAGRRKNGEEFLHGRGAARPRAQSE